jgi:hypothetical protein
VLIKTLPSGCKTNRIIISFVLFLFQMKKLAFLLLFPAFAFSQSTYTITRDYPNITRPIQIGIVPLNFEASDWGTVLRYGINLNAEYKNHFSLQAALASPLVNMDNKNSDKFPGYSQRKVIISYHNLGFTYYFFNQIKAKEVKIVLSRSGSASSNTEMVTYTMLPAHISRSYGVRAGITGYKHNIKIRENYYYGINKDNPNDTNYVTTEMSTIQSASVVYFGVSTRKIINAIYKFGDDTKRSARAVKDLYFDILVSTGISYDPFYTPVDQKSWLMRMPDESEHKLGWIFGYSFYRPTGKGIFLKFEVGSRPRRNDFVPGFMMLTLGWDFGIKCEPLTQPKEDL